MTTMDVRYLHKPFGAKRPVCVHDGQPYPCETLVALGPDLLDPPLRLPEQFDADGNSLGWPGDPRFTVRVRSPHGEAVEQVVEAYSLVGALEEAMKIPFKKWMGKE